MYVNRLQTRFGHPVDQMQEILNTTNINELSESMNFETELFKSKKVKEERKLKKSAGFEGLLKRFFHLKINIKVPKKKLKNNNNNSNKKKKKKNLFEEERLMVWDEITKKESKEFHKMDRLAKYKLSKIIPNEISRKRFQDLVIPRESAPNDLKRVFQYLAFAVKFDLISECTSTDETVYRPLTFPPESIKRGGAKRHPVNINDWHAANLMIFQNLANLLYGISLSFCNPSSCPIMTIGKDYEYMWCDGITFVNPISIPARTYMKFCLLWTQKQLKDSDLIPSTPTTILYPPNTFITWKMIYRRLLRVYAHLYINHKGDFDKIGYLGMVIQCMLRRFILYGIESDLTSKKELEPVKNVLKKVKKEFHTNKSQE